MSIQTTNCNDWVSAMSGKTHNLGAGGVSILKNTPMLDIMGKDIANKRAWQKMRRMCNAVGLLWNDEGERL